MCCGYEEVAPTLEVTLERKTFKALEPARMQVHLGDKRIQRYESSLPQGLSSVFDGWHFVFRDVLAFALGVRLTDLLWRPQSTTQYRNFADPCSDHIPMRG